MCSEECNSALSGYFDLRCRTLRRLHRGGFGLEFAGDTEESSDGDRNGGGAPQVLFSDDPAAWEVALTRPPHARRTSAAVRKDKGFENERSSGDVTNTRQGRGEMSEEILSVDASGHEIIMEEVASNSLHELDRIRLNLVSLRDAVQIGAEGLHASQGWKDQPHNSWTIYSPAGCRIEEVR